MTILAKILQGDRVDLELIQLTLETLTNVMTFDENNEEGRTNFELVLFSLKFFVLNIFRTKKFTSGHQRAIHR